MLNRLQSLLATIIGVGAFLTNISVNITGENRVEEENQEQVALVKAYKTTAKVEQETKLSNPIQLPGIEFSFGGEPASANFLQGVLDFAVEHKQQIRNSADSVTHQVHVGSVDDKGSSNEIIAACVDLALEKKALYGNRYHALATRGFGLISSRKENGSWQCYKRQLKR